MKQIIVIDEQHSLLPSQEGLLRQDYSTLKVPSTGWAYEEQLDIANRLAMSAKEEAARLGDSRPWDEPVLEVVFVSPVPALMVLLARWSGMHRDDCGGPIMEVRVFHNDRREKKELPGGRIVFTVARDGWQLV